MLPRPAEMKRSTCLKFSLVLLLSLCAASRKLSEGKACVDRGRSNK